MECWIIISLSYGVLGNDAFARAAFEYARVVWGVWTGDDWEFEEVCGKKGGGGIATNLLMGAALGGGGRS